MQPYNSHKAGMCTDRVAIDKIIDEVTRDSSFSKMKAEKIAKTQKKVESWKKVLEKDSRHPPTNLIHSRACFALLEEARQKARRRCIANISPMKSFCVIDMDMFFAAVEIRDNPSIAELPVAVGTSVVSTSNYIARKYGVRSAMPGFVANELCRRQGVELVFLDVDMPRYVEASRDFQNVLDENGLTYKMLSLDEAYIEIVKEFPPTSEGEADMKSYVDEIRDKIFKRTKLTCSAGISVNCINLAKIGSDEMKPNGSFAVPCDYDNMILWFNSLPVSRLRGVGPTLGLELKLCWGIERIGDIVQHIEELFIIYGETTTQWLIESALGCPSLGISFSEDGPSKSISQERSFSPTSLRSSNSFLKDLLTSLCGRVVEQLNLEELLCRTITVKIKSFDWRVEQKSKTVPSTDDSIDVYRLANSLLKEISKRFDSKPRDYKVDHSDNSTSNSDDFQIRLLGIRLSNFVKKNEKSDVILNMKGEIERMNIKDLLQKTFVSEECVMIRECHTISNNTTNQNVINDCSILQQEVRNKSDPIEIPQSGIPNSEKIIPGIKRFLVPVRKEDKKKRRKIETIVLSD